jgi:outer membrane lipoprotein SlyB
MFTFLRAPAALGGVAVLGLLLTGCAAGGTRMAVAPAAATASGPLYATVALVRPVPAAAATEQTAILAAMGAVPAGAEGEGRSEILVRTDDGQTLSVVTTQAAGFAPGTRVVLLPGAPLRLGRPGMTAPAS